MSSKYRFGDDQIPHFITFSTVQWVDVFTRQEYKDIFIESLIYCQNNKGLKLHAFVIMSNHVHLIASAQEGLRLSDIIRDLKKFTSKRIIKEIEENSVESRKRWMLWLFLSAGKENSNNKKYQFWQQDNHPIELSTIDMIEQRLHYLHHNPVKSGIVKAAEEYIYSSAIDYAGGKGMLELDIIE